MGMRAIIRPGNHSYRENKMSKEPSTQEILQDENIQHELSVHEPVQHEERLSQYAQQIDDISASEEIQAGDTSHCKGFPMTICINSPTSEQVRQNRVAIAEGGGAYNNMMPLFQQMTNLADTDPYLYGIMWQSLNETLALMNSETTRGCQSSTQGIILTQPCVDRSRKRIRKRQKTSPIQPRK